MLFQSYFSNCFIIIFFLFCYYFSLTNPFYRRLLDEEDELSEVQPDAVPNEVREWLAATFTRNNTQKKRTDEKPKFRSVANAIRAGIMVDKLYRRVYTTNIMQMSSKLVDKLKVNILVCCFFLTFFILLALQLG